MAETNGNGSSGAKLWQLVVVVISLGVPGLVAWGSTQATVSGHETRLSTLEASERERPKHDSKVLERLAVIETQLKTLVDAEIRRQQREGR